MDFLFSFRGRLNRAPYWMFLIASTVISLGLITAAMPIFGLGWSDFVPAEGRLTEKEYELYGLFNFVGIALLLPSSAITVRRLHDRNKSGWMVVLFLLIPWSLGTYETYAIVPYGGLGAMRVAAQIFTTLVDIWALIELGFLRGTKGDNRYGPDPLPPDAYVKPAGLA